MTAPKKVAAKVAPPKPEPKPVDDGLVEVVVIGTQEIDGKAAGAVVRLSPLQAYQLAQGRHVALSERGRAMSSKDQAERFEELLT